MSVLVVPTVDDKPWESLGPLVVEWIESNLTFGPGGLIGEPAIVDRETRAIIRRAYEIFPKGHAFEGRRRFQTVSISLPKGTAKCLAPDTLILTQDGTQKLASEVTVGDKIVGWDNGPVLSTVRSVEAQRPETMVRIITVSGREIITTPEHPFLKSGTKGQYPSLGHDYAKHHYVDEWVPASELISGDRLVPCLGYLGTENIPEHTAWLLGAIVGDGGGDGRFTNVDKEILDRIREKYIVTLCKAPKDQNWYIRGIHPLLREHKLFGCNSRSKRVPPQVMCGDRKTVAAFLAGYLDTDGSVYSQRKHETNSVVRNVEWGSVNRILLSECQTLLAGLGVNARLKESRGKYLGKLHISWKLTVTGRSQVRILNEVLPLAHKGKRERLKYAAETPGSESALVGLDPIKSVTLLPESESIAIEVDGSHTHITNGLVTHNTERAGWITIAEAHPEAPVRFAGWDDDGNPMGMGVVDPYIPLLATTEGQSETTTYDVVKTVLERSVVKDDFRIGLGRITLADGRGRIEAVATEPDSLDGKRTTFQVVDEGHRLTSSKDLKAHQTMMGNAIKRKDADPWTLMTTTAFMPGQGSVAEMAMDTAKKIEAGEVREPSLFFFHRQASDGHNLDDEDEVLEALHEALGPSSEWANIQGMMSNWRNPMVDNTYFERVHLNRPVLTKNQIFDIQSIKSQIDVRANPWPVKSSTLVSLGFDGSRTQDATALIGTEIQTGYQFVIGLWEKPEGAEGWEVPGEEVDQAFKDAMNRWRVKCALCDRAFWETYVDMWAGRWPKIVVVFPTSAIRKTAIAVKSYVTAWRAGEVTYDGHTKFVQHLVNARRRELPQVDEDGEPLYLMEKSAKGSPDKIDAAYAGCLSWEARAVAIKKGALRKSGAVYFP